MIATDDDGSGTDFNSQGILNGIFIEKGVLYYAMLNK